MALMLSHRVLLIGDVHQEHEALAHALAWAKDQGVQSTLCVGDIADGPGDLQRCCELLAQPHIHTVRGNHERWALRGAMRDLPDAATTDVVDVSRVFLEALPSTRTFDTPRGPLLLCHGIGEVDMAELRPDHEGYDLEINTQLHELLAAKTHTIMVGGHTHRRMARRIDDMMFVNAGTLYRAHRPCVGILDFDDESVTFFDVSRHGVGDRKETLPL